MSLMSIVGKSASSAISAVSLHDESDREKLRDRRDLPAPYFTANLTGSEAYFKERF
jgi:hypothetical protein